MKAVLALIVIYVERFWWPFRGLARRGPGRRAIRRQAGRGRTLSRHRSRKGRGYPHSAGPCRSPGIRSRNPSIRSAEQYREKLLASVPNNEKSQVFVNTVIIGYEKRFDVDQITEQLVAIYDKHYPAEEIKELLQFYGSPLGQRMAAEGPKFPGNSGRHPCRRLQRP